MTEIINLEESLKIPVDPEPASFRVILVVVLILGFVIGYMGTSALLSLAACNLIGIFTGFGLGAVFMQLMERFAKPYWKSNRFVQMTFKSFDTIEDEDVRAIIDPMRDFEAHLWRFDVPRRTRVPKGWYVVGVALEQDDLLLPVYTLISPEDFQKMPYNERFVKLKSQKEMDAEGANMRLAGQQRRLLKAEAARNLHGAEMLPEDFKLYLHWLHTHYGQWMAR